MATILNIIDLDNYEIPALPECPKCGVEVIEVNHWRRAGETERAEMLADGYVRIGKGGAVCVECDPVDIFSVETRRRQGLRGETVRVYHELTADGMTKQEIADRLGIQHRSLNRALSDYRKREIA